jgi:ferredoxin
MTEQKRTLLVCSCEDTMPLDGTAIERGCMGAKLKTARHLCRAEVEKFRAELASGDPLTVACTQEAPLFSEIAEEAAPDADIAFANVRETAGWSKDARAAGPKMAALLAAAAEPMPDFPLVSLASDGVVLVYGRDERTIEAAKLLKDRLDVTVMLTKPGDIVPLRVTEFPVIKGTVRTARGHLGAFELTVDDFAQAAPSSRDKLVWGAARDGATSNCDIVLDLSGGAPLFPAHDLRDGYVRADPGDPAAVLRAVLKAADLVGTFDKPRYVNFTEHLCAHSRSRIVGCRRCLDLCPTGAITPNGNHVRIDENICAGCGACAAVCPTGAASYALPPADALMRKLRTLLTAYREAGGKEPIVLLHDAPHGEGMIDALARHGDGLPANVLPIAVNEVTQVGFEAVAAAFAYGAASVRFLLRAKARHDVSGIARTISYLEPVLAGLGFGPGLVATIETDDPDALGAALSAIEAGKQAKAPASFQPMGAKRDVMKLALRELHRTAPAPVDVIALPQGAPFGKVQVNVEGCTLCLSCVSACPTGAMMDDPERPMLRFAEDACVQCGLCQATCPEKVISLVPQIDFTAVTAPARVLKQEEPFHCISCGKPFGTKSTIERVTAKLEGKHWMFKGQPKRLDVLKMCDSCRVIAMTEDSVDPYGAPERPKVRTTEDYLREREERERGQKT